MLRKKSVNKGATQKLQVEVDVMEQRIVGLKHILQSQKAKDQTQISQGSTRWSSASTNIPLKNYGKHVLQKHRENTKVLQQQKTNSKISSRPSSRSSSFSSASNKQQSIQKSFLAQDLSASINIANENLTKALQIQKQFANEVVKFLTSINLEQHASTLLKNGFDEIDILKEIKSEHLKEMNINKKDADKIINQVQQIIQNEKQIQQESEQKTQRVKESKEIDGNIYDEEEQHRLFLEALLEFRQQKQQQQSPILIKDEPYEGHISSRINKKEQQQKNKMKFLLQGQSDWQMFDLGFDQSNSTGQQQIILNKSSCYQCYKLFNYNNAIIQDTKEFCCKQCIEQYNLSNIYLCRASCCAKQININNSYYDVGQWFCNQECFKQYQWECTNIRGRTNISL